MSVKEEKALINKVFHMSKVLSDLSNEFQNELIEKCYTFMCKFEYDINERTIQLYTMGVLDGMIIHLEKILKE